MHGVPFTVKDTICAAGVVMAMAIPSAAASATRTRPVARMKAAGAILLGKTNCPEYGGGIETDNPVYGRTSNPWTSRARRAAAAAARPRSRGARLALRARHGLGRQRPASRALLRARLAQADRRARPGHGRDRRRGAARRARRPAHPGRAARALRRRRRAAAAASPARTAPTAASRPCRWATPRRSSCAGCGSRCRSTTARAPTPRPSRRSRRGRRAARRRRRGRGGASPRRWPRAHDRGVGELRRRARRAPDLWRLLRRWDAFRARMLAFAGHST